jgi:CubicO group peptidase (beta-lactamase class C family)
METQERTMHVTTVETAMETAIKRYVDAGELAGAAMLVWRDGEATTICVGLRDLETGQPVERDTIFRIASMSKPVTSTLALMLFEDGRFALSDPITRWAPEFSNMRVLRSPEGPLDETEPAERTITFEDLLTHRSGLTYGDFHRGPIAAAYRQALGGDIDTDVSPNEWIARLAALPLIDQPGRQFHYSKSTDLLGLLIERIEDAPLADVLKRRLFDPLGMTDTGFSVAEKNYGRRAGLNGFNAEGRLATLQSVPGGHALTERPKSMTFVSGGQGLWSTLDDYLAFGRLFAEGGAVDGVRLLRPDTLSMMASNRLTDGQRATSRMFGMPLFAQGHGFGMGVAVVMEPEKADPIRCGGGKGSVGWPGAYGGWWQADPNDGSVMIFLAHNMVQLEQLASGVGLGVWSAIGEFQSIASGSAAGQVT